MKKVWMILLFTTLGGFAFGQQSQLPDLRRLGEELVGNGDFEQGLNGWRVSHKIDDKVSLDKDEERGQVMKLENHEPEAYGFVTFPVRASAGQSLYVSAWVKSAGVQIVDASRDRQTPAVASVFIEAYGSSNADQRGHLRGTYPKGLEEGEGQWQYISGVLRVPEGTDSVRVGLYLGGRNRVGTAWFDEVSVRVLEAPLLDSALRYPNYRGLADSSSTRPWVLDARGRIYAEWPRVTLRSVVRNGQGEQLFQELADIPSGEYAVSFSVMPEAPAPGVYTWELELLSPEGKVEATANHQIEVVSRMPRVYVDEEGFTVADGERIFPLGIYTGRNLELYNGPAALQLMADAGFNTVLSYTYGSQVSISRAREFLDEAEAVGLRVVYSLKDMYHGKGSGQWRYPRNGVTGLKDAARYVEALRDHAALIAWNINDEFGPNRMKELERMYDLVAKEDPQHPVYQLLIPHQVSPEYLNALDIWGSDPYPIGHRALELVSRATSDITRISEGRKGVWQVLQVFNWKNYLSQRYVDAQHPTLEEKRNMTWQALISGTRGLLYYSYYDLHLTPDDGRWQHPASSAAFEERWADMQLLLSEIRPLVPIILHNQVQELRRLVPSVLQYRAWQTPDGRMMIGVVNVSETTATLKLAIPAGWQLAADQSLSANGTNVDFTGEELSITLGGKGSGSVFLVPSK